MHKMTAVLIPIVFLVFGPGCGQETTLVQYGPERPEQEGPYRMASQGEPTGIDEGSQVVRDELSGERDAVYGIRVGIETPVVVGAPTPYTVAVLMDVFDVTASFEIEVEVRPSAGVTQAPSTLIFTTPGDYDLVVTATREDMVVKGTQAIPVVIGLPAVLTVEASPETAKAGEEVVFTLSAVDSVGNAVDPAMLDATLTIQPGDIELSEGVMSQSLTVPGRYEVHAELESGVSDIDVFYVTAGDPYTLDLTLANHGILGLGDAVDYTIEVADMYGNPIEVHNARVFTEPSQGTEVEARRIRFEEEGTYTVVAGIPGGTLEDEDGPVVVDGYGPIITITSPQRAAVRTSASTAVTGTVVDNVTGVTSVLINGQAVTLGRNGAFSRTLTASAPGIQMIEVTATDGAGHESNAVQSFLYGTAFTPTGNAASSTLIGRVNQGTFNMLEDYVEGELTPAYLRALVMANPRLFKYYYDFYIDDGNVWADVTDFSVSSVRLELIPRAGYVELQAYVYNIYVRVHVNGDSWYVPSIYGNVTADYARLTGRVALGVSNGNITATLSNVGVTFSNSNLDIDGIPSLLSFIEDWIWDYAEDKVKEAIIDAVYEEAPPAIDEYLSDLEIPRMPIDMYGHRLWFQVIPESFSMLSSGVNLYLKSIVDPATVDPDYADGPGALATNSTLPTFASTPGFILSVADDFVNQALYAIWESGVINDAFQAEGADAVDLSFLNMLAPDAAGFELAIDPLLPPVFVVKVSGSALGEVQAGDMLIDVTAVYGNGSRSLLAQVAVSAFAGVRFGIDEDNNAEFEVVGTPTFYFDGLISTIPNLTDDDLETLLEALVPVLVPTMIQGVQRFPLPSFEGLTINNPAVNVAGAFINMSGNLVLQ